MPVLIHKQNIYLITHIYIYILNIIIYNILLAQCGLNVNKSKCATLNIIINPKKKQWICNPYSFISIDNYTIKALNIEDTYRYLGINIGALDNKNN